MLRISTQLLRTFTVGESSQISRVFSKQDVIDFARISGDDNSIHMHGDKTVVHGTLLLGMFSAIGGTKLPGDGALLGIDKLKFHEPVYTDTPITATLTISRNLRNKFLITNAKIVHEQSQKLLVSAEVSLKI